MKRKDGGPEGKSRKRARLYDETSRVRALRADEASADWDKVAARVGRDPNEELKGRSILEV